MEKSEVSKPKQKVELSTLHAMAPQQDPVITPKEGGVQSKKLDAMQAIGTEDIMQLAAHLDANKPLVVTIPCQSSPMDSLTCAVFNGQKLLHRDCNCLILLHVLKKNQVSEASVSRNRSTIIVPAGTAQDEGWAAFRNILAEINEAANLFILPNQQNSESAERLVGLSDDVGAGFIAGHSSQPAPASDLNVDRSVDMPPTDEIGNLAVSKVIRVDQKRFFFDLGSNNRGHFLRISEVPDRSSIILPLSGLKHFYEMVGHFVEITKDRIEGLTGANVRTVDPPQR
ncbi:purin-rich alpha 1 [Actinidia rufa]|uniref:Purin-rich alpha 1 n=1 Tax=Actinidia rufa TaxID=165716 RepID=A0A7J0HCL4_9ERIC|nr:purin-rich alpha 1 [Actinidia rufa]